MATQKQILANRANARRSTGPTSSAGKARSALNALKSGIYAESLLLPDEKLEDLQSLIDDYYSSHRPTSAAARAVLDNLIRAEWLLRRLARIDTQLLGYEMKHLSRPESGYTAGQAYALLRKSMPNIQQRITAVDLAFHRSLRALEALQPEIDPDAPTAEPDEPESSTAQSSEITPETPQSASFPESVATDPTGHPLDIRHCPNCNFLRYRSASCRYDIRRASA